MKKIIYSVIFSAALLCLVGCEDVLDKTPDGQITIDKVIENYSRTKGLLDAAYGEIYPVRDQIIFVHSTFDELTDNCFRGNTYCPYEWHNGSLSLSNPVIRWSWSVPSEQLWPDFWRGIRLSNNVIKYVPMSTAVTKQECQTWVAEAKVLRAWYYMNLLEFYGPVFWVEEPFDPNFTGWNELVRPTYDEISTIICNDLDEVINSGILPDRQPVNEAKHVDVGVARAIKARILLNNASILNNPENDKDKWKRAAKAAEDVLAMTEYSLVPMSEYKHLFVGAFSTPVSEIIWRSNYSNNHINNTNGVDVGFYPYADITHCYNVGGVPTQELVDCFEMKNGAMPVTYDDATHLKVTVTPEAAELGYSEDPGGDPYSNRDARFYVDVLYNGANYGAPYNCTEDYIIETFEGGRNGVVENYILESQKSCTGYYNRKDCQIKYWGPGGSSGCEETHWVYFRLTEFYLNAAEAYCELGDFDKAMYYLDAIRERALQPKLEDVPGYEKTYDFIMGRIRNERRVEFCMEGWRFHDQRRWKILNKTNRFVTGMRIYKDDNGILNYERKKIRDYQSYTDKYLVMPIPLSDAKKMTGMTQPEAWR